ncbi:MAG: hypothetical protein GX111_04940 [Clostridiales bacterium]|nr:hypothetical protein [Clostridiales bacterium]
METYNKTDYMDNKMNNQMMNYRQQEKPMSQMLQSQTMQTLPMQSQIPQARQTPTQMMGTQSAAPHIPMQQSVTSPMMGGGQPMGSLSSMTPTTLETTYYTPGLLRSFIGEMMRVQFLIGTTGPLIDITGTLVEVGATYIILQPINTDDLMVCDLYSIKFVTIFR